MFPAHFREKREHFEDWGKYHRDYWPREYADFARFFLSNVYSEPHSTKQLEDALGWAADTSGETLVRTVNNGGAAAKRVLGSMVS